MSVSTCWTAPPFSIWILAAGQLEDTEIETIKAGEGDKKGILKSEEHMPPSPQWKLYPWFLESYHTVAVGLNMVLSSAAYLWRWLTIDNWETFLKGQKS